MVVILSHELKYSRIYKKRYLITYELKEYPKIPETWKMQNSSIRNSNIQAERAYNDRFVLDTYVQRVTTRHA